jgi:hypothetical protein
MATKATARKTPARKTAMSATQTKSKTRPIVAVGGCAPGVCDPQRTQGLATNVAQGDHVLVTLKGPSIFLGAEVTKQGGTNDITFVILDIDGRNVTNLSYAGAANSGLTQQNPYGLVLLTSVALKNLTIGFPTPLRYRRELKLSVSVNEPGVVQILANVIHGR